MGDTDENSDSDNSKLNQTIAPTRIKADKARRRAKDFSEELLNVRKMTEQSSSSILVSKPSGPGVSTASMSTTNVPVSSVLSTTSNVSTRIEELTSRRMQNITNPESGFNPAAASTIMEATGSSANMIAAMNSRFDQLELTGRTSIAINQENHQELCGAIHNMTQVLKNLCDKLDTRFGLVSTSAAESI